MNLQMLSTIYSNHTHFNKIKRLATGAMQKFTSSSRQIIALLILNCSMYGLHIWQNCQDIFYFFQLTIIGQTLVVINFALSLFQHQRRSSLKIKLFLSRLHLVTISLESIIVLGFWGLRIFFAKGIIDQSLERDYLTEYLSFWVHGGSFLTMFYFVKRDHILMESKKSKKFVFHLFGWGLPFISLQYLHWLLTQKHVYGFLVHFDWVQLCVFEVSLYLLAVGFDYCLTLRHGYKLSLKELQALNNVTIYDLQRKKAQKQKADEISEQEKVRGKSL